MKRWLLLGLLAACLLTNAASAQMLQGIVSDSSEGTNAVANPTVVQDDNTFISEGSCNSSCAVFSKTTAGGNLIYIGVGEFSPSSAGIWTINCNGTPATGLVTSTASGGSAVGGSLYSCPAASGALAITASKGSSKGAVFQFVEVHSASGTPSSDGFQFGVGSGSNVATGTLSSPTTSANDILIAFGTRGGGPSGQTFTGGGAGSWTPICVTLGAYQNETTMSAFSVTLTMTGGSGDTAMTFVAVHP